MDTEDFKLLINFIRYNKPQNICLQLFILWYDAPSLTQNNW